MRTSTLNASRRTFLKSSTALSGGLLIGFYLPVGGRAAYAMTDSADAAFAPNAFIRIAKDGTVTVIVGKSEMGQGVLTALPQIVAEELDADWKKVKYQQSPTHPDYARPVINIMLTGGSTSVRTSWDQLRKAGATARSMLMTAAADTWKADPATLKTENGYVMGPGGKKLSYGQLADKAATMPVPKEVKLKGPQDFKLIGKSAKRLDTPAKVDGSGQFGIDVKLPGLLTAVMAFPPVFGASIERFDATKAKAVAGVKDVVKISNGIAVVGDGYWAAKQGRDVLEVQWTEGVVADLTQEKLWSGFREAAKRDGVVARMEGDVAKVTAANVIKAAYELPYLAHACMEPMNCTAWVKPDGAEIWAGTQSQTLAQQNVAKIVGLKPEQVKVNTMLLGGGFGRRIVQDFIIHATEIAKAMNAPVKLIYSREDDMRGGYYRPAAYTELEAGLDDTGAPMSFKAKLVVPSLAESTGFRRLMDDKGVDRAAVEGLADLPYAIPNIRVDWVKHDTGIPVWFWRSVGASHNTAVSESFIDELAHAAGKDPLQFRLALLDKHPRYQGVLKLAAEKAGWGKPLQQGRARGIAVTECFAGWTAQVAEVSLQGGKVRVHRVVCAADAGTVINPDIIKAQITSAIVFGLSAALYGEITWKDGRVEQGNYDRYPVLRMGETPAVEVYLVESKEPPGGVGEPGTPPIAPAVLNALFSLTGKRVRKLPIDAAQLKAA